MAIREIIERGDPVLEKKCHAVTKFDKKLWDLIDDLHDTLDEAHGAGLAAPQVGILRRVVLVLNEKDEVLELVNPELIEQEGEQDGLEGCLSLPGLWGFVKRPMRAKVRAQDRNGAWFEVEGTEMVARCFCHEIDHLDGRLYSEHCDELITTEQLEEMEAAAAEEAAKKAEEQDSGAAQTEEA